MKTLTASLLLLAVMFDHYVVTASPMMDDGASFDEHLPPANLPDSEVTTQIKEILMLMKAEGEEFKVKNKNDVNQFLVVAVLSYRELINNTLPANRKEVLLNRKMNDLPVYYNAEQVDVHGEILALYFDQTIYKFVDQLTAAPESDASQIPYVFVYSHYIPCAGMSHIQYSCAEELNNAGLVNKKRYKIVVGFVETWKATDRNLSLQYLQEGGIHMSINVSNGQVYRQANRVAAEIYQKYMLDCLRLSLDISNGLAAYYINVNSKYCTENITQYGFMTLLGRSQMHDCVSSFVSSFVNEHPIKKHIYFCSTNTMARDLRLKLGKPEHMCTDLWEDSPDDLKWSDLYSDVHVADVTPLSESSFTEKISDREFRRMCTDEIKLTESKRDRSSRNLYQNKEYQKIRELEKKTKTKERLS